MKVPKKVRQLLYDAIHEEIVDLRLDLRSQIDSGKDFKIAQVIRKIWNRQEVILKDAHGRQGRQVATH